MARVNTNTLEGIMAASNPSTPTYTSGLTPDQLAVERARESGKVSSLAPEPVISTTSTLPPFTATATNNATNPPLTPTAPPKVTVVSTYTDPATGDIWAVNSDGSKTLLAKSGANQAASKAAADVMKAELTAMGLGALADTIDGLMRENMSAPELKLALMNSPAYQTRFSANKDRIAAGLRALTPAEYIGLEDQYQNIMRRYGMPESYYAKDATGKQPGFDKFLAADVSATELEDRIATAQKRVINADVNVSNALKQFYPDITNGDILAYTLDPKNALENIKRKVTAAEIGGAAMQQGLATGLSRAEELAGYGVTKAQAQQGYQAIGEFLPTAEKLGDIYAKQGLGAYDQATAESEIFNTQGAAKAGQKRKKLAELEKASFSGSTGAAQGALARERAGSF